MIDITSATHEINTSGINVLFQQDRTFALKAIHADLRAFFRDKKAAYECLKAELLAGVRFMHRNGKKRSELFLLRAQETRRQTTHLWLVMEIRPTLHEANELHDAFHLVQVAVARGLSR